MAIIDSQFSDLEKQLDFVFDNDKSIISLACIRIDGHPLYIKTNRPVEYFQKLKIRLVALCQMLLIAGTDIIQLAGDGSLRTLSIRSDDSRVAIRFSDFFILVVETSLQGNAKGIVQQLNAHWQEKSS